MRVLKFISNHTKPYYWYLLGIFIATCIVAIDSTLKPFLIKRLIDMAADKADDNLWMICIFFGLLQGMLICSWVLSDYCLIRYTVRFRLDVAEYFMKRFYMYPYTFFQNQLAGSLTAKFGDAFQLIPVLIFTALNQFFYFLLLIIISIFFLYNVAPIFAISMLIWVTFFFIFTFLSMKKALILTKNYSEGKSKILGLSADYLNNMFSVKTFTTQYFELARFWKLKKEFVDRSESMGFYFMRFYAFQGIFASVYATGFIVFLIIDYQKSILTPGDFALVTMTNFTIMTTIYQLSHTLREFVPNWGSVDQALSILDRVPDIQDKLGAQNLHIDKGQIVFDTVMFYYKNSSPLFQKLSVTIESEQKVGLVGYSGSGKSTFVNLILRLYDVCEGRILIDGQNICDLIQDSLRAHITIIPQDPSLFHRSLMENIRYGRINASDEEVIEAAKRAYAHDFIISLPYGYDSLVGERGVKLSGGQRQRIAIARAILKNSPIVIFDEATSSMDSITESLIQKSLWNLMKNKTTIIIAHRLSTLLHMDRILVFDQGKIVQDGTHSELLSKSGLYKTLWDAQASGFLPDTKSEIVSI